MKRIRQAVTYLCLATTSYVSLTSVAMAGEASQAAEPASTPIVHTAAKLDLSQLGRMEAWSAQAMASPEAPIPVRVQMQTSGGERSSLSTAKKTWIIVGSVLGAAAGVVAFIHRIHSGGGPP